MLLGYIFPHSFNQYLLTGHLLPGGPLLGSEQTSDTEPWLSPHRPPLCLLWLADKWTERAQCGQDDESLKRATLES